ncbi:Metal-dependent hydrolase, endonuclease/exonuclease/phosphatase family [Palleronia marisminoris]|uniref:Endonuclease/Exonuclease/phosphatase family protein n=1 Tax=Palleronia marisminoris TaxID=315423 RepID=A0A1Y5TP58_9RHOB|nr:endonuclease/exonuclease/phosphatase family protein [Palleronia marisminoris]SFH40234.1 Metal-dependent hydrolase, endonuclease/exonuclease/phosphatase family [Palleronia marisminoris]SLN64995.1 Endonuclease/Exonuclease/phosphatase family protein [Palleronia marisminoris]
MVRLVSYNIRKAVGLDWRRDPFRIAHALAESGADIVALQEADKRLGPRPAALPREAVDATGLAPVLTGDGPSLGWHGNAVLVRPDWPARVIDRLPLPGVEPRGALIVWVDTPEGPLTLCATHMGLLRPSRLLQMAAISAAMEAHGPGTVIAGDMNEWSRRIGFETWTEHLTMLDPGPSFHASRPVAHLDRFLIGPAWQAKGCGVLRNAATARASDHLPVWADLIPAQTS